jgi:hypothetical protein
MAKKRKPKYYVAQVGGNNFNWSIPENSTPSIVNQTATGATDIYGNQYFKPDESGTPTTNNPNVVPIDHKGNRIFDNLINYGQKDLHPAIQDLNAGMQAVTGVASMINEVNNRKYEKDQYLRAITPDYYENMEGYGLNANPIFTKFGGATKYQVGGQNTENDYEMNAQLAYYKGLLNDKLKAKNPQAFTNYFSGLRDLRVKGDQAAIDKYIQDTPYNDYLSPDEVKSTLGETDYTIYSAYLNAKKPKLAGQVEGEQDYGTLNYGRRFASLPFTTSYSQTNTTSGKRYSRDYTFNPKTGLPSWTETGDISLRPQGFSTTQPSFTKENEAEAMKIVNELTSNKPVMKKNGGIVKTYGLQQGGKALANVEAEKGEPFQTVDGEIAQVANDAPTHDQGGVFLPNVHRVLENTSNLRKDKTSKLLKLTSEDVKATTGADVKGTMSHAEALVKANDFFETKREKITKKMKLAAKDRQDLDKYGELSTKLNMDQFAAMPSKEQLFEQLFNRQEMVKAANNISTEGKAKNGGIMKAQLGAYSGSKTGKKTPAGNSDAFPATKDFTFDDYLKDLTAKGFKYEGITNAADFQAALYDYQLKNSPDDIRKMWSEGMHQKGMAQAKQWGFVDDKGLFKPGVLDDPKNLEKLKTLYPDGFLGPRTMRLTKGSTPPRIWSDDDIPTDTQVPVIQELDTSITTPNIIQQARSRFNEPLRWYDVASPVNAYIAALEREPGKYNPMEFNQLRYKLLDPTAALQQNQADFNAAAAAVNTGTGTGAANIANLAASKYAANNQVLGNYENQNAQIKNNEITYNTQVRDKNSLADQQARELFENKVLTSKAIQQEQKLTALDSLYKTIAENRALNRNGNLVMKFSRAFDQYGDYNGYQHMFQIPPTFGVQTQTGTNTTTQPGGGLQQIKEGKDYYNRRSGKTYYFDGNRLLQRK